MGKMDMLEVFVDRVRLIDDEQGVFRAGVGYVGFIDLE